jgi:hypothetical protein
MNQSVKEWAIFGRFLNPSANPAGSPARAGDPSPAAYDSVVHRPLHSITERVANRPVKGYPIRPGTLNHGTENKWTSLQRRPP